jgi:hypothetical protein
MFRRFILAILIAAALPMASVRASEPSDKFFYPVQAFVQLLPGQLTVTVQNVYAFPLVCEGRVQAVAASGVWGWLGFGIPLIYPGSFGYAYLAAGFADPIVNGWAEAYCQPAF